jgi:hypothetical protein
MNLDQKRHLAATLCLMEKDLLREEQLLRSHGEKGILYEIVDPLPEGQHQKLLALIATLRQCFIQAKCRFGLEVEKTSLHRMLVGELTMLWVWLQDTKTKKLRGYGAVDEELQRRLDPLLEEMEGLIDDALKTLAEA